MARYLTSSYRFRRVAPPPFCQGADGRAPQATSRGEEGWRCDSDSVVESWVSYAACAARRGRSQAFWGKWQMLTVYYWKFFAFLVCHLWHARNHAISEPRVHWLPFYCCGKHPTKATLRKGGCHDSEFEGAAPSSEGDGVAGA